MKITPNFTLWLSDMTQEWGLSPNFCVLWWQNFPSFFSHLVNLAGPCPKVCLQTWCEIQALSPDFLIWKYPPPPLQGMYLVLVLCIQDDSNVHNIGIHKKCQYCMHILYHIPWNDIYSAIILSTWRLLSYMPYAGWYKKISEILTMDEQLFEDSFLF